MQSNYSNNWNGKIETDLNKYVTERAIDGLFKLVEIQKKLEKAQKNI